MHREDAMVDLYFQIKTTKFHDFLR
jgi:hypothetical protein